MGQPTYKAAGVVDVGFGDGVVIYEPVNLYGCDLGNDVIIGPFVEIQKGVRIGDRTRVQSHAFICEGVTVGADCFVSHGAMFINDTFATGTRAHGDRTLYRETRIESGVMIGTGAIILPVSICSGAVVGAGSVVTKNITEPGIYAGNPARLLKRLQPGKTE